MKFAHWKWFRKTRSPTNHNRLQAGKSGKTDDHQQEK